jgi:hypothetical protein
LKYNGREVEDFTIGVQLGENKVCVTLEQFKANEKFVAKQLRKHDVHGWDYVEAPIDDLVLIVPLVYDIESVNTLFCEVQDIFKNVYISIQYTDFDENSHNVKEITECLDISLYEE